MFGDDYAAWEIPRKTLCGLRALRLWHWREALKERKLSTSAAEGHMAERYHAAANFHLGQVQLLNDFFAIGDTAERDAEREDTKRPT